MNKRFFGILIFVIACSLFAGVAAQRDVPQRGFVSTQPATTWEEGLICGNGTIGANVFSRPLEETIIFTHERLFLPTGPPLIPPDNGDRLFEIRQLIDRELYAQATQLAFDFSGQESFMYPDPFVPAFDMNIIMDTDEDILDYMRSVNFQTGETTVHWKDKNGIFERRMFVSRADGIAVMLIDGSGKGSVNCRLKLKAREPSDKLRERQLEYSASRFESHVADIVTTAEGSTLTWKNSFTRSYPGSIQSMEGMAYVDATNGQVKSEGETLIITGADEVLVLVDLRPVYDPEKTYMEDMKLKLTGISEGYDALLARHAQIHGEMFNRMKLDIGGGSDHALTTEELLEKTSNENLNRALVEKAFDAGRYNIISCTGELPPTLQGIWAGTYAPDWASDFTHNGNVPSAIASMLMGNTPELMLAYTSYIESIVPYLEINAQHMFGARGIVLPSRSTTNGFNNALAPSFAGGFWVGGAAWAAHFFYDYYLYTGDKEFLSEHALPFMKKAAFFFEDYLYEGPDGKYIFSPTQSPENSPLNTKSQGTFNATMDVAAAKELFNNLITASNELDVNQEKISIWKAMLDKMPDYMISEEGYIKEWITPKLEDNLQHRHTSQLYPLYDGIPDEIKNDPELQKAFRKIIEIKLNRHWNPNSSSGFMSFGLVQLGQASTSLGEEELAYTCLLQLVNRYWLNNLASMHNHKTLFNMDISGGMPAVLIKMLAFSEPGRIQLLPALPEAWTEGSIEGILCRGQVEIRKLEWKQDRIHLTLLSEVDQQIMVEIPHDIIKISVQKGKAKTEETGQKNSRLLSLEAKQDVSVEIIW
jgi:alpha-L-fucosidase 2